jgi:hypothetical protein
MPVHVLLVLLDEVSGEELESAVAAAPEGELALYVVAPSHVGALDWLATDERRGQGEAMARALEVEWLLDGVGELGGEAGEGDPALAVADALQRFPGELILVVGRGSIDPAVLEALEAFGLPVVLSGVTAGPSSPASGARALWRGLRSGRNSATPFVALLAANLGFVLLAVLGSALVLLAVWLIGTL